MAQKDVLLNLQSIFAHFGSSCGVIRVTGYWFRKDRKTLIPLELIVERSKHLPNYCSVILEHSFRNKYENKTTSLPASALSAPYLPTKEGKPTFADSRVLYFDATKKIQSGSYCVASESRRKLIGTLCILEDVRW
jgi:hypothetical protein